MGCLLWNLGSNCFCFGSVSQISDRTGRFVNVDVKRNQKSQGMTNVLNNVDYVPSNVQSSRQEDLLYVFEENEAVIKNDHEREESHNETCFQDSQSCT